MIGKIAMIAVVVMGLRWLAADAPVSPRTVPMDAAATADVPDGSCAQGRTPQQRERVSAAHRDTSAPRATSAQRDNPGRRVPSSAPHEDANEDEREPMVSAQDRERLKEVGGQLWTLARPMLVLVADKALDGIASLLRSAADSIPRSHAAANPEPPAGSQSN
jgi:hypothetical protein